MADTASMALDGLLRKAQLSDDVDFLREGVRVLACILTNSKWPATKIIAGTSSNSHSVRWIRASI